MLGLSSSSTPDDAIKKLLDKINVNVNANTALTNVNARIRADFGIYSGTSDSKYTAKNLYLSIKNPFFIFISYATGIRAGICIKGENTRMAAYGSGGSYFEDMRVTFESNKIVLGTYSNESGTSYMHLALGY